MPLATIPEAIEDIRQGKLVILVDDEDRENEGDLCMAAEKATPEAVNFMAPEEILDYLVVHELCHMVHPNHSAEYWEFVESFLPDYRKLRKWLRENGHRLSFADVV